MDCHPGAPDYEQPAEKDDRCECEQTEGQDANHSQRHQPNPKPKEERPVAVQFLDSPQR